MNSPVKDKFIRETLVSDLFTVELRFKQKV